MNNFMHVNCCG